MGLGEHMTFDSLIAIIMMKQLLCFVKRWHGYPVLGNSIIH